MAVIDKDPRAWSRVTSVASRGVALTLLAALCVTLVAVTVTFVDRAVAASLVSAAGVSLVIGLLAGFRPHTAGVRHNSRPHVYAERLDELTAALRHPSRELDRLLDELAVVTAERQNAINTLTDQLAALAVQEHELRQRNAELLSVSIPAVQAFAAVNAEGENRSRRRDYLLFVVGLGISVALMAIGLVLQGC